jgi:hypothetical protein
MSAEGYFYPIDTTRHERVLFGKVGRLGSGAPVVVVPKIPSSSNVEQLCTVGSKVDANYRNKIKMQSASVCSSDCTFYAK